MIILFREIITIYFENHMKYINIPYRKNVEFVNFNPCGPIVNVNSTVLSAVPGPCRAQIDKIFCSVLCWFP
jgi:hypothetical protein